MSEKKMSDREVEVRRIRYEDYPTVAELEAMPRSFRIAYVDYLIQCGVKDFHVLAGKFGATDAIARRKLNNFLVGLNRVDPDYVLKVPPEIDTLIAKQEIWETDLSNGRNANLRVSFRDVLNYTVEKNYAATTHAFSARSIRTLVDKCVIRSGEPAEEETSKATEVEDIMEEEQMREEKEMAADGTTEMDGWKENEDGDFEFCGSGFSRKKTFFVTVKTDGNLADLYCASSTLLNGVEEIAKQTNISISVEEA